jgi:hypothetical protein
MSELVSPAISLLSLSIVSTNESLEENKMTNLFTEVFTSQLRIKLLLKELKQMCLEDGISDRDEFRKSAKVKTALMLATYDKFQIEALKDQTFDRAKVFEIM